MIIDQKKQDAINMLVQGTMKRTDIASKLEISRTTLYDWMNNADFIAALDKAQRQIKDFGERNIAAKLNTAIDEYWELRNTTTNEAVKNDIYRYFIDRSLGKPTSKLDVNAESNFPRKTIDADELQKELDEFDTIDEPKNKDKEKASSQSE
ncbi:phBC6A51 family helix-turn-helix protein [Sporolactobacillus terrae]|uniref:phBC6A51 family helix-turn-helix protein n=1 Tax=Sporolactobacillus terrae TaxID=269673 RepID=UPI0011181549|nr:phBC6A51 family helix-turn-helix protein [Sporolactobacillus terrae]